MASNSAQPVQIPELKPVETTRAPRPVQRPVDKPWTVKIAASIPT